MLCRVLLLWCCTSRASVTRVMSVHLGKFLVWASVGSTAAAEALMGGRGHLKRILDREPVVALSCVLGGIGFFAPQIIPPIRRSMGYDTSQWDGRPGEAPMTSKQVCVCCALPLQSFFFSCTLRDESAFKAVVRLQLRSVSSRRVVQWMRTHRWQL